MSTPLGEPPEHELPHDWYRTSFSTNVDAIFCQERGEEKAHQAMGMLDPAGDEKVLDLACATGLRTLELCRMGFPTIGIDPRVELLEIGSWSANAVSPPAEFFEGEPRDLKYEEEFDIVLSVGGGAFEHYNDDEECEQAIAAAAKALRPGGRLLMQLPNARYVERQLPRRTWIREGEVAELIDQRWDETSRRIDGTCLTLIEGGSAFENTMRGFQRRIYGIEELTEILARNGMVVGEVFDEDGKPCTPSVQQLEIYVEARKVSDEDPDSAS